MANITTEDKTSIQFVIPKAAKEFLEAIAEERSTKSQRVFVSDLIRDALKEKYNGQISFDVDRGGDRRGKVE